MDRITLCPEPTVASGPQPITHLTDGEEGEVGEDESTDSWVFHGREGNNGKMMLS